MMDDDRIIKVVVIFAGPAPSTYTEVLMARSLSESGGAGKRLPGENENG